MNKCVRCFEEIEERESIYPIQRGVKINKQFPLCTNCWLDIDAPDPNLQDSRISISIGHLLHLLMEVDFSERAEVLSERFGNMSATELGS